MVQRRTTLIVWLINRQPLRSEVSQTIGLVALRSQVDTRHPVSGLLVDISSQLAQDVDQFVVAVVCCMVEGGSSIL